MAGIMRGLPRCQQRVLFTLLGVSFIWCLIFGYVMLNVAENKWGSVSRGLGPALPQQERMKARDIFRRIDKFLNDLFTIMEHSGESLDTRSLSVPPPTPTKNLKEELEMLQLKLEAEQEKGEMRKMKNMELHADKIYLQHQVTFLQELIQRQEKKLEKEKQEKSDIGQKCLRHDIENYLRPGSTDGFPHCEEKVKWMTEQWNSDICYHEYGVNGSLWSILIYLSEVESWCPVLPGRVQPTPPEKKEIAEAVVLENLQGLYLSLQNTKEYQWILQRLRSMEENWIKAIQSLSAKNDLRGRTVRHIVVHPGALTRESGMNIAKHAFSGGPLGELVQWSDLIATLYVLGHHVYLSASIIDLEKYFRLFIHNGGCPIRNQRVNISLIYTDIVGVKQMQHFLKDAWTKYSCMVRVLDTFGTEPDFNHKTWADIHGRGSPFGGLNLAPKQFYTMFPHTPDNTFLGFAVEQQLSQEETLPRQPTRRLDQSLVYGKNAEFWEGKSAYLDIIHEHLEVHATVNGSGFIPSYVINHGIIKGTEVQRLLRQSKVFVGLSFPYEGPAPLEAIANGCAFLNPKLQPPRGRHNTPFFKGKPTLRELTSQHPYAEAIGEPYVWTVDIRDAADVRRAMRGIMSQSIEPYIPYEFTCEGMLQRVNVLIEKQDFCSAQGNWPPLSVLQVINAEAGISCKQACQQAGLVCEPTFFSHLNTAETLAKHKVSCQTSEFSHSSVVFPAYNSSQHCLLQSYPLLFSCVRSDPSLTRVCPCRDFIKGQIALCKACV